MSKPSNPDLVRRILDIAREELGEKPADKVNMRAIADRAGVSATAIYYYFESKEELFERIKFDALADLDKHVSTAVERESDPIRRLTAFITAYATWCLENYNCARLLMDELPPNLELNEETMRKYYSVFFRACELAEDAMAKGLMKKRDALLEVSVMQAAVWGIVSQFRAKRVHPRFWDSIDPLIDRCVELYFAQ
jgi:AcrR family transcriptional regulator